MPSLRWSFTFWHAVDTADVITNLKFCVSRLRVLELWHPQYCMLHCDHVTVMDWIAGTVGQHATLGQAVSKQQLSTLVLKCIFDVCVFAGRLLTVQWWRQSSWLQTPRPFSVRVGRFRSCRRLLILSGLIQQYRPYQMTTLLQLHICCM